MQLDNVLNSEDTRTANAFENLQPLAIASEHQAVDALAYHQITSLHLVQVPDISHRTSSFGIQPLGIIIHSQLVSANITPGHITNVVDIDGKKADLDDQDRQDDETAIYVMSHNEAIDAIRSGAYDNPQGWERALNGGLRGVPYQRATRLQLDTLKLRSNPYVHLSTIKHAPEYDYLSVSMVSSSEDTMYFSHSTVDNDFGFALDEAMNDIRKEYVANDSGFRIDKALVMEQRQHNHRLLTSTSRMLASFDARHGVTHKINSASTIAHSGLHLQRNGSIINPLDTHKKAQTANKHHNNMNHVSMKGQTVAHELQFSNPDKPKQAADMAKRRNALAEAKRPHGINHVSKKAAPVENEIDLKSGLDANGHAKSHHEVDPDAKKKEEAKLNQGKFASLRKGMINHHMNNRDQPEQPDQP